MKVKTSISPSKELHDILTDLAREHSMNLSEYIETRMRMNPEVQAKLRLKTPAIFKL